MATRDFRGGAIATAQTKTYTPAGVAINDIYNISFTDRHGVAHLVSFTATTTVVADVVAGLVAAWNASIDEPFFRATAFNDTTTMRCLADAAGVPFSEASGMLETLTVTGTGTGTFTPATTVANSGPNDWNTPKNWTGDAVPVNGDSVYFRDSSVDCLYGFVQTGGGLTLALLEIAASYTGKLGLPNYNTGEGRWEGRRTYLEIGATICNIGRGAGAGSSRLRLNFGSVACTLSVDLTAATALTGTSALQVAGSSLTLVTVQKGTVGLGVEPGQAATITTLNIGSDNAPATDAVVRTGPLATVATCVQHGGELRTEAGIATTYTITSGLGVIDGTGASGTITIMGGIVYYESSGTAAKINNMTGGTLDYRRNPRARTVTACDLYAGSATYDAQKTVTWTAGLDYNGCGLADLTLDLGKNFRLTPGAVA